jgi:hypothetical protein
MAPNALLFQLEPLRLGWDAAIWCPCRTKPSPYDTYLRYFVRGRICTSGCEADECKGPRISNYGSVVDGMEVSLTN